MKAHIYYAVANGSSNLLGQFIKYAGDNDEYIEFPVDRKEDYYKYAVQIAQGRILGLETILDYIVDGSLAGMWDRGSHFWDLFSGNDAAKKEAYRNSFQQAIDLVKKLAVILRLNLPQKIY